MTPNQQKEELSKAYVHAIAARCGYSLGHWTQDQNGIDVTVGASLDLGDARLVSDPKIDLQLKCTSNHKQVLGDQRIAWQIKRGLYNKMVQRSLAPKVLVILLLPEDDAEWVRHSADELVLRRCAYWKLLTGEPSDASVAETTTVHVSMESVFSPDALRAMMQRVSTGALP